VLRDAQRLTTFPHEMTSQRNLAENNILRIILSSEPDTEVMAYVDDYFKNRLHSCMMNQEFAQKVKGSDNGHIYLKMLREKVIEELGLD
jgi:hypothetical protein